MKKKLKSLGTPALVLLALAAVLLGGGMAGSTRAALNYYSDVYQSEIDLPQIGVELYENGDMAGRRNYSWDAENTSLAAAAAYNDETDSGWDTDGGKELLQTLTPAEGETIGETSGFQIGTKYKEELAVKNSGTIPVFVRVNVYRYWTEKDTDGNEVKVQALNPAYIELEWNEGSGWTVDETASTPERTVLYYTHSLAAGAYTEPFTKTFSVSDQVKEAVEKVETEADGNKFTTTYTYSGKQFRLEAVAEVVQAGNGQDAVVSSWGVRNVKIDGDSLTVYGTDVITHESTPEEEKPGGDASGNDVSGNEGQKEPVDTVSGNDTDKAVTSAGSISGNAGSGTA